MTQPGVERAVPGELRWRSAVGVASACAAFGLVLALAGARLPAPLATIGLGAGILGASFLLSWAGDAAEVDLSGGLVIAGITFLTILPELTIEVRFAFTQQTELVSANLTGATRLLLTAAVAMPLLVMWLLARRGEEAESFSLPPARRVELGILLIAALYGIVLALLHRVSMLDGALLIGLYLFYLLRVRGTPDEPPAIVGVSAGLAALPQRERWTWLGGMLGLAVITIVAIVEPFAVALQETGAIVGISPYLVVQSIVPAATEAPEFVVAAVLAISHRPAQGLAIFLGAAVSQWTLALGVLPMAYAAGGGPSALPLRGHDPIEVALTVTTTLLAVAALSSLRPLRIDAWIVLTVYVIQFAFPAPELRIAAAIVLAMFALDVMVANRRALPPMFAALRSRRPPPEPPG
jgi:cation:H+ antiporter